jgi:rhamnosyltransferase
MKIGVFVPTYNAEHHWHRFIAGMEKQSLRIDAKLCIDSNSSDNTVTLARASGFQVIEIPFCEYDHSRTRNLGVRLLDDHDIIIFLTQDAILADENAFANLIASFEDAKVGSAYGRQLPRLGASPIEAHARLFNYDAVSLVKAYASRTELGIKTVFISNSFSAYRLTAFDDVAGFPSRSIVSEDTFIAAKMLLAGWKIAYCANAKVHHSHNYNWRQDFQRYFDVGVFHAREPWIRREFGGAEGEGLRFLKSEVKYLLREAPHLIPSAMVRTAIKYLGFRVGLAERYLTLPLKQHLSMQKAFWLQDGQGGDDASRAGKTH